MKGLKLKNQKRIRRKKSIRKNLFGYTEKPRVSVYRSHKHIYGQIIDDVNGKTLASASDKDIKTKGKPVEIAMEVGKALGEKAKKAKITTVVFDRNGYKYHGRVKSFADGLRESGLKF